MWPWLAGLLTHVNANFKLVAILLPLALGGWDHRCVLAHFRVNCQGSIDRDQARSLTALDKNSAKTLSTALNCPCTTTPQMPPYCQDQVPEGMNSGYTKMLV